MKRIVIAGIAAILILSVAAIFFLAQPTSSSCSYPAPVDSNLPAILKSIGGFDQSRDPDDVTDLEANAVSAATAQYSNLIGVSAQSPVHETALHGGPSAVVVPLVGSTTDGNRVVALVAYLSDCSGRVYYNKIDYLGSGTTTVYPTVSQQTASSQLHQQTPQLQFTGDPFHPIWTASGAQISAT